MIRDDYYNGFQQFASANFQMRLAAEDSQIQGLSPTSADVICGRGKKIFEHKGNVNFRSLVMGKLPEYKAAVSKAQKSAVVSSVFDEVTVEGHFIKQSPQTERWYVVSEAAAREKISQCFRDCLQDKYESTKSRKPKKRKQAREITKSVEPETDSPPPAPKRTKLFRSQTAPATIAYSSKDAFQQLVKFAKSVMPPARRSSSLEPPSSPNRSYWFEEDLEPLGLDDIEPIAFPVLSVHPDLEPTSYQSVWSQSL